MSDRKKKKSNIDDLNQFRSLIGDAQGDDFSLDDILAEYGAGKGPGRGAVPVESAEEETEGPDLPWPEASRTPREAAKVLAFPGTADPAAEDGDEPDEELPCGEEPSDPEAGDEETGGEESEDEDRVIEFPEEESVLSAFLKDVGRKADDYADRMFEEDERTDPEEVRRLERLIPGTDREEEPEPFDIRRIRKPRAPEPPPPDTPPAELAKTYGKGLKGMRMRVLLLFFLAVVAVAQLVIPALGFVWLSPWIEPISSTGAPWACWPWARCWPWMYWPRGSGGPFTARREWTPLPPCPVSLPWRTAFCWPWIRRAGGCPIPPWP